MKKALIYTLYTLIAIAHGTMAAPMNTAFTYQGKLNQAGTAANGSFDFDFRLADGPSNSTPFASNPMFAVPVSNGLFTVQLDFGTGYFNGDSRWLEIAVRAGGNGNFTTLAPRTPLTPTPYALYADRAGTALTALTADSANSATLAATATQAASTPWDGVTGKPVGFADGIDNDTTYSAGPGINLAGTQFSAVFAGSGASNTVARSDHHHFAQLWTGSATNAGLRVHNTFSSGSGVVGKQGPGTGLPSVAGVVGDASYADGVAGVSGSLRGVYGRVTSTNTENYGVYGFSPSTIGVGTFGLASAKSGNAIGVVGQSDSFVGIGVKGIATASSGLTYGGYFSNNAGSGAGIYAASSNATAARFEIKNTANNDPALIVETLGTGKAAQFNILNINSDADALTASTTGDGSAIFAQTTGDGHAGSFLSYGTNAAVGAEGFSGAAGLYARSSSGSALLVRSLSGAAIDIASGAIRVRGAGTNTATPVFIHKCTPQNLVLDSDDHPYYTIIDNPYCNGKPSAILILTVRNREGGVPSLRYDVATARWRLVSNGNDSMWYDTEYNIMIVTP